MREVLSPYQAIHVRRANAVCSKERSSTPWQEVLRLLDSDEAGAVWDDASQTLQQSAPRAAFVARLKSMRDAVGELQERTAKGIGFVTNMPDAPPGYYAGAFFESRFARATVEEKVVFVRQDGQWRVSGYFMTKRFRLPVAPGKT